MRQPGYHHSVAARFLPALSLASLHHAPFCNHCMEFNKSFLTVLIDSTKTQKRLLHEQPFHPYSSLIKFISYISGLVFHMVHHASE